MSLASDLLDQANTLAGLDPKKPKQASLRRAISAAYYSGFHLLIDDGARRITTKEALINTTSSLKPNLILTNETMLSEFCTFEAHRSPRNGFKGASTMQLTLVFD